MRRFSKSVRSSSVVPAAKRVVLTLGTVLLTLSFAAGKAPAANRVIAIGDSWGALIPSALDAQFKSHGHDDYDTLNIAVPGSTAAAYAQNVAGVLDFTVATIAATLDAQYVLISLGGNDLVGGYPSLGVAVYDQIESNLRYIVDRILAVRPDINIILTGYDILKFDKSTFCLALAYTQFAKVLPWEVSPLFLEVGARQKAIDDSYPKVTYLNLWGTGQGSPGLPNVLAWSPSAYVATTDEDCVHLSDAGYAQFAAQIYKAYFAPRLPPACGGITLGSRPSGPAVLIPWLIPLAATRWLRRRSAEGRRARGR